MFHQMKVVISITFIAFPQTHLKVYARKFNVQVKQEMIDREPMVTEVCKVGVC